MATTGGTAMRNTLTFIFISIIFAVVLMLALSYPGEIVVKLTNYPDITINFYFFIATLIVLGLVLVGLLKTISSLIRLPNLLNKIQYRRRTKKYEQLFHEALNLYLCGDYAQAARLFLKAAKSKTCPRMLAGLFAADAALLNNDTETAHRAITLAGAAPGEDIAADLIAADLAISDESPERAASRINEIIAEKTNNLRAIRMLIKLCDKSGAWHLAERVLGQLDNALKDAPHKQQQIRSQITSALMGQAAEQKDKKRFNRLWQQTDEATRETLLERYVTLSVQLGNAKEAENHLEKVITHDYNEVAITQYGLLPNAGVDQRIKRTEQWLAKRPENPALLLCLARLYKSNARLDKAREYFEKSLAIKPDYQAWQELSTLS